MFTTLNTTDLSNQALDFAVAKALGFRYVGVQEDPMSGEPMVIMSDMFSTLNMRELRFTSDDYWGIRILQQERISTSYDGKQWTASIGGSNNASGSFIMEAAMRSLVLSKLGKQVEIPVAITSKLRG